MTAKKQKMLTAVFRDRTSANRAFDWLQQRGYASSEINILMSDSTRSAFERHHDSDHLTAKSKAPEGMAAGGAIGTAVGATLAAVAAIGTNILVPGLGMVVAGPIVAAFAGGGAGAVAGGLVGALVGFGISESNAKVYEEALRDGGVVFGVVPHSAKETSNIKAYFEEHGAENIVTA